MAKYHLKLKGTVGYWDFSKDRVDDVLDKMAGQQVNVLIDSLGGYVKDALSISSAFREHGNVHVHYRGMNASAATISSMGAKHISIDASALYLVHKCAFTVFEWDSLNADQLIQKAAEYQKMASEAEKIDLTIATLYAKRCKKSPAQLHALMAENKWLTAQEALEWGFVDEVTDPGEKITLKASVATAMAAEGIPVPDMEVEADGFMEKMLAVLQKAFRTGNGNAAESTAGGAATPERGNAAHTEPQTPPQTENKNHKMTKAMNKVFALVAAVLAAANVPELEDCVEGKYTLDGQQLDAIEAALKSAQEKETAHAEEKTRLEEQLANANATIEELRQTPPADDAHVVDDRAGDGGKKQDSPLDTMAENIAEARRMIGLN